MYEVCCFSLGTTTSDEAIWVSAGFTVLGALIGAIATLFAARFTWRRQHYNEAASQFRAAFVDAIYALRGGQEDVFKVLTSSVLADQERALIRFEQFLKPHEKRQLQEAWAKYSTGPHTASPGSLDRRPREIAVAQSNIEAILQCAAPK